MRSRLASIAAFALAALSCGTRQPASVRAAAAVPPVEAYCGEQPCSWFDEPGACQFIAGWLQLPGGPFTDVRLLDPVIGENSVTQDGQTYAVNLLEGYTFDWSATRPVSFVVAANGHDSLVYAYPAPVTSDTELTAWSNLPPTQVLFCVEPLPPPPQGSLSASATASAGFTRSWAWQIAKSSPTPSVTAAVDATVAVTWAVTVQATSVDSGWSAGGTLVLTNPSTVDVGGVTIEASFAGAPVLPTCPLTPPLTLPAGGSVTCTWAAAEGAAVDGVFVATVSSPEVAAPAGATAAVAFGAPTAEPDGCVAVSDTLAGELGTVCATAGLGGAGARVAPWTFTYRRDAGPYATCDATGTAYSVSNTASYTAPSGANGSSTFAVGVRVPCSSTGCTLTQGYWKNHSKEGPAPYDERWKNVGPLEEDTAFFLSGQTWIEVFREPVNGAYYALAHQYMAAKLNVLAGAPADALGGALAAAEAFFAASAPATLLTVPQEAEVLAVADLLDRFNNGEIGPGHCDDAEPGGGDDDGEGEGGDDGEGEGGDGDGDVPADPCDREEPRDRCDGDGPRDRCDRGGPRDRCDRGVPRDACHAGHDHRRHEECREHEREDKARGHCREHEKHGACRKHDAEDREKRDGCEKRRRAKAHEERHRACREHHARDASSGCEDPVEHEECRAHEEDDDRP